MKNNLERIPSPLLSLVPIFVLVGLLFFTIRIFGSSTLEGASQVILLIATAVCCLIAMTYGRVSWKKIERAIVTNMAGIASALLILLLIGALSGSWMVSGIIPTLIYYGIQIIHPDFFLVSTCLICALVSVMIGSSWTTIATIGIALMGIGKVQGFDEGWIAGAIISGAYFGDKISPLSDTTVLASSVTGTPLFVHIRYMMITTLPSMCLALLVFLVAGFSNQAISIQEMHVFTAALDHSFEISLWLLAVPVLMGLLIARKVPPLITLFLSVTAAAICSLIFQPGLLHQIAQAGAPDIQSLYKGLFMSIYGQTQVETGNMLLNELVTTRGMGGMLNTIWLIMCAMCFGGAMAASHMLTSITQVFLRFMKRTVGVVASTICSGLFLNICTADQYLSIILTGDMFKNIYKEKGYENRLLSRTVEDGVTVTSPLIPWNTCGMTHATVLGVSTFVYLPFCFFNLISPLMSIFIAATGYKIKKIIHEKV